MPDAFTDPTKAMRSYIPATNVHAKIDVPYERQTCIPKRWDATNVLSRLPYLDRHAQHSTASQSYALIQKCGRPVG